MKLLPVLLAALVLGSCALPGTWRPSPVRVPEPLLVRGWSFVEPASESWKLDAGQPPVSYSGPLVVGEKLVFGSERFGLTVLSKRTGQVLWRKAVPEGIQALPYAHESYLYLGTESGRLMRLGLEGGQEGWEVSLGAPVHGSLVIAFDRLYVATADEALHSLDPATGKLLWTYRRPAYSGTRIRGGGHPSVIGGRIWAGFSDGALVSLEPHTGRLESEKLFRDNLKFTDLDAKVLGWKDGLLVSTYDGKLRYLRPDGSLIWEFEAGGARAPIVTEGEVIYLPSSDGTVYALSGATGKELWRYPLKRGVPTGMALVRKGETSRLVVAASENRLYVLNGASGGLLAESSFGRNSGSYAPIAADAETGSFFVLSAYSRIYQFHLNL